jgi:hypothetical protein
MDESVRLARMEAKLDQIMDRMERSEQSQEKYKD